MYPDTYEKIIYALCEKHQISIQKIENEPLYKLTKDDYVHFIWSRRFDINTTIACRIADNKHATYSVLNTSGIPVIPCIKIPRIDTTDYSRLNIGIYELCDKLLKQFETVVVKPNNSCEGIDVHKCSCMQDIEKVLFQITAKYKYLVISPYIDADAEYRLFFLDNKILYAYKKVREYIICDGVSTVGELLLHNKMNISTVMQDISSQYGKVYPKGFKLQLNWKFNLSQGANCVAIKDNKLYKELCTLALSAANAIGIRFATVDILVDRFANKQILEINAGVAMDHFIIKNPHGVEIATSIYERALTAMFNENLVLDRG